MRPCRSGVSRDRDTCTTAQARLLSCNGLGAAIANSHHESSTTPCRSGASRDRESRMPPQGRLTRLRA
ncbi:hypothetical protein LC55x_0585 [Lysobacter capsici]|nr:hypothetical protein LC55x_0585 [Lysobacter capsici]